MKTIFIGKQFGKYLLGRQEGVDSFNAFEQITENFRNNKEKIFCDFSEVLVLNSSFADEMFGEYERKYPRTIILDTSMNNTCKKAFEVLQEVHGTTFIFQ
jgi:hypothetical protein